MHEEPLHLIPEELREEVGREYGIYIEGDLCPACRQTVRDKFGGRIEEVPVQRIAFSEKNRIGIGTFTPSDPKSQDISELTGSVDLVTGVWGGFAVKPRRQLLREQLPPRFFTIAVTFSGGVRFECRRAGPSD